MEVLSFILLLVIGGFAGWAATRVFKVNKQNYVFSYVLIGAAGAAIGKFILGLAGFEATRYGVVVDFLVAFVGAVALVGISKLIAGKFIK